MNKLTVAIGTVALLVGGYYLGHSNRPEPTVIKLPSEPKAAFTSSGAEEVAAAGRDVSTDWRQPPRRDWPSSSWWFPVSSSGR